MGFDNNTLGYEHFPHKFGWWLPLRARNISWVPNKIDFTLLWKWRSSKHCI